MEKIIHPRFALRVEEPNQLVTGTFELDKNVKHVTGIALSSDRDDLLYYRGSQKIELSKEELFQETHESKRLMSGINVPPNHRFYFFKQKKDAGNGMIKMSYQDTENYTSRFRPYWVFLYVECELAA